MTPNGIKRLVLSVLTLIAILLVGASLVASWSQPQIQSRLELYQTNLMLQASEWQEAPLGDDLYQAALEQYQSVRSRDRQAYEDAKSLAAELSAGLDSSVAAEAQRSLVELDLRIGILQAHQGQGQKALDIWTDLQTGDLPIADAPTSEEQQNLEAAAILTGLWSDPAKILPDAEVVLQKTLDGWFRYQALAKLYQLQERQESLERLRATAQQIARSAGMKLAIVVGIPAAGFFLGCAVILFAVWQWFRKGKESLLSLSADAGWETPWNWETVWQVLIVGFFFVGQIVVPLGLQLLGITPEGLSNTLRALYILGSYAMLAGGGILVLYLSVREYLPLPSDWFRVEWQGKSALWGLGGYVAAIPIVIVVSLINQQIWQGKGGSNPILPIALEGRNGTALAIFFLTASLAAPLYEEILFRGFLLPSLTRYMPAWGAIALSSTLFAIAHLNLSEVAPLLALGMVLGFVYMRSRNLLAPMLLHSLWNSGTLLSLVVLGSGADG